MATVEAVLAYRPHGLGGEHSVPLGATAAASVLRALRDELLGAAWRDARAWRDIDPGLFAMKRAEAKRLEQLLQILIPDDDPKSSVGRLFKVTSPPPSATPTDDEASDD
jgi:hypothetical protein